MGATTIGAPIPLAAAAMSPTATRLAVAPSPGITLSQQAAGSVLSGRPTTVTLTATNSGPVAEYNLTFRDMLPAGVSYVAGSTTPTSAGEPRVVTESTTGRQTVLWSNTADLQVGSAYSITFSVRPDPVGLLVGTVFANTAQAYASTAPRTVPAFDATGVLVPEPAIQAATSNTTSTTISALEITKTEPSPEAELPRGVHDHPTTYTVTVRNTATAATSEVIVTDYLAAGLEYLGCGAGDNTPPAQSSIRVRSGCPTRRRSRRTARRRLRWTPSGTRHRSAAPATPLGPTPR